MKEQLLSIADYLESLEQRIAALESANLALQDKLANLDSPAPEPAPAPAPEPELPVIPFIPDIPETPETPETPEIPAPAQPAQPVQPAQLGSVSNIRQAISLGDRFLFQRELFANNGELMQKTLDEINALANLGEAEQYIARFNWDPETTTYKLFLNVLKRRF